MRRDHFEHEFGGALFVLKNMNYSEMSPVPIYANAIVISIPIHPIEKENRNRVAIAKCQIISGVNGPLNGIIPYLQLVVLYRRTACGWAPTHHVLVNKSLGLVYTDP